MATSPAGLSAIFREIRRRRPSKVKFVYRAIISVSFDFRTCYDSANEAHSRRHSGRFLGPRKARHRGIEPGIQMWHSTSGFRVRAKGVSRNDAMAKDTGRRRQ